MTEPSPPRRRCAAPRCAAALSACNTSGYCRQHWRRVPLAEKLHHADRQRLRAATARRPMVSAAPGPQPIEQRVAELLTVAEVARYLRCSPRTVRRMLRDTRLTGLRRGGSGPWLITRLSLIAYVSDALAAAETPEVLRVAARDARALGSPEPPGPLDWPDAGPNDPTLDPGADGHA